MLGIKRLNTLHGIQTGQMPVAILFLSRLFPAAIKAIYLGIRRP